MPKLGCKKPNVSRKLTGRKLSKETKLKIGDALKGKKKPPFTNKHKENIGKSKKGQIPWIKGKQHTFETRIKLSKSHKGIKRPYRSGEKCNFWKGGITEKNKLIKTGIEYRLWREAVFARDNWVCQKCKIKGGKLQVHHVKNFAKYPELRTSIQNGITLCIDCHKKTDTYAGKNNKKNVEMTKEEYEAKMKELK